MKLPTTLRFLLHFNISTITNKLCIYFRCGCDECMASRSEDSLRHSRSRINAYRALAR